MKLIRKSIFALASALMLTACSSDEPFVGDDPNGGSQEGEGVYMGLTIQMPGTGGSRSQTVEPGQSTDGNEVGKDYENTVTDVIIVLANPSDNSFITAGTVATNKITAVPDANAYKTVAKVDKTNLKTFYDKTTDRTVNVFVFCNPTVAMQTLFSGLQYGNTTWVDEITTVTENLSDIALKNHFLMANASIALRQVPADINDWDVYKTEETAFNLSGLNNIGSAPIDNLNNDRGAVKVERAAARFDFRDGSPKGNNTYDVVKDLTDNETVLIQVQIGKMALVNISKTFYDLRRVSNDGMPVGTLCGAETPKNYVVGPNAAAFSAAVQNEFGFSEDNNAYNFQFSNYFFSPFFDQKGRMDFTVWNNASLVSDILGTNTESDNWQGSEKYPDLKNAYKIWRYATENVIPATESNQQNGISTGVVFKAKMLPTEALKTSNEKLYNALKGQGITGTSDTDPILYNYQGILYCSWDQVRQAAIQASVLMNNNVPVLDENKKLTVNRSNSLYRAVFGTGGIGEFTWGETPYNDDELAPDATSANSFWNAWNANKNDDNLSAMRAAVTGAGFTIYQSSVDTQLGGAGYYCYYYYWNRHNDNGDNGAMGPMEFAVVRNNVYKLAVTGIKQLGHPRIPENDPDKPKPDTPDESSDIYITVTCQVLPWVVRVNNIEF